MRRRWTAAALACAAAILWSSGAEAQRRPAAGGRSVARAAAPVTVTLVRWPYT